MYEVKFSGNVIKSLKKLDKQIVRMIIGWIDKNLQGTDNPRNKGKSLSYNKKDIWRYRVGSYRILANINDEEIIIVLIDIGHRKDIYL